MNIYGWNTEKRDIILYLNSTFKPIYICLKETGKSKYLPKDVSSPFILNYNSVFLRTSPKTPQYERILYWCSFFVLFLQRTIFIQIYHFSKYYFFLESIMYYWKYLLSSKQMEGSKTSCFVELSQ